ncbi:hypothetical protein EON65_15850 [archaeon]|nr:MAG: hypothetical protein EON65_15850 [archaeon]
MSLSKNLIESCVKGEAVRESCVLSRYVTSPKDVMAMKAHLERYSHEEWIPVYWEIDVADENNGWFPGFALHISDSPQLRLHIAVPNEHGTAYDGEVQVDWRVVRLRRCIQENTASLFKKLVRDSVYSIKWDVDFLDSRDSLPITLTEDNCIDIASPKDHCRKGKWEQSVARYYVSMLNLLLIEDSSKSPLTHKSDTDHIVLPVHRHTLRLRYCHKLKGLGVFEVLVFEEGIRCSQQGREQIKYAAMTRYQDDLKGIRK